MLVRSITKGVFILFLIIGGGRRKWYHPPHCYWLHCNHRHVQLSQHTCQQYSLALLWYDGIYGSQRVSFSLSCITDQFVTLARHNVGWLRVKDSKTSPQLLVNQNLWWWLHGRSLRIGQISQQFSLVPRPSPPPVFDCLQYAKPGGGEGLGTRAIRSLHRLITQIVDLVDTAWCSIQ